MVLPDIPKKPKVVVIGSCNTDMTVKAARLPVPGETVVGGVFHMDSGGKGANQAIAAARLGADVTFISKVGNDLFGMQALELYRTEMIYTGYVFTDPDSPSGVALISVDSFGENCIIVAAGANNSLSKENIDKALSKIMEADIILLQLEIPMETVAYACDIAHRFGKKVILNPAPAHILPPEMIKSLYAVLPNRIEAEMLSGIKVTDTKSAEKAAKIISAKGVDNVVITLGSEGAYIKDGDRCEMIPGYTVETIDTTGAGDVFCGAVSVFVSEGHTLTDAVRLANQAASLAVTRVGAQSAIPHRNELEIPKYNVDPTDLSD